MLFIIVWSIVRLLVMSKNITKGSKRLQLVQKAAFHSFPGLMWTLLNLQHIYHFVKYWISWSSETSSEISRRGYQFFYCDSIESPIVLNKLQETIFLLNEKH